MDIDIKDLAEKMAAAAFGVIKDKTPKVVAFAQPEFSKLAVTMASIESNLLAGHITEEQAKILVDMQKNASRTVILGIEGMSLLAAEQAINAALTVARPIVNAAVGIALL